MRIPWLVVAALAISPGAAGEPAFALWSSTTESIVGVDGPADLQLQNVTAFNETAVVIGTAYPAAVALLVESPDGTRRVEWLLTRGWQAEVNGLLTRLDGHEASLVALSSAVQEVNASVVHMAAAVDNVDVGQEVRDSLAQLEDAQHATTTAVAAAATQSSVDALRNRLKDVASDRHAPDWYEAPKEQSQLPLYALLLIAAASPFIARLLPLGLEKAPKEPEEDDPDPTPSKPTKEEAQDLLWGRPANGHVEDPALAPVVAEAV